MCFSDFDQMATISDSVKCKVCGGNEFTKDAGYYYCIECQTQTHELREHVHEFDETLKGTRATVTTISRSEGDTKSNSGLTSTSKKGPKLTSWEVFNYVLAGVTNEIIGLGASVELCDVAKSVWLYYLTKLGIMHNIDDPRMPRLGLGHRKWDAAIVYGVGIKRRRSKSIASSSSLGDVSGMAYNKECRKRRRALIQADYTNVKRNMKGSDTKSLENAALSELQSSDSDSSTGPQKPKYNPKAAKCLRTPKKYRRTCKTEYNETPYHLTRDKIYSIACLSCLICSENKWMPADILRACQQGHISYLDYTHMLPTDINPSDVLPSMRGPKVCPTHRSIRRSMKLIADLLKINVGLFQPDLYGLIARYCSELNLPDEIKNMATNLLHEIPPKFANKKSKHVPNYEGRSMSYILYVLKVLFGLDNKSEYIQSHFATEINQKLHGNQFILTDWIKFLQYRNLILKRFHCPFAYYENENPNLQIFFTYLKGLRENDDEDTLNLRKKVLEKSLKDLEIYEGSNFLSPLNFDYNTKLLSNYVNVVKAQKLQIDDRKIEEILFETFTDRKLDYVFHYKDFLKELYKDNYAVLKKGAHGNSVYVNLEDMKEFKQGLFGVRQDFQRVDTKNTYERWLENFESNKFEYLFTNELENFVLNKKLRPSSPQPATTLKIKNRITVEQVITPKNNKNKCGRDKSGRFCKKNSANDRQDENYHDRRKRGTYFVSSWTDNPVLNETVQNTLYIDTGGQSLIDKAKKMVEKIAPQKRKKNQEENKDFIYFLPQNEYWVLGNDYLTIVNWKRMKKMLPPTFVFILNEMAKVCGQSPRCLFEEFFVLETYLNFVHFKFPVNANDLEKIIPDVQKKW